MHSRFVRLGSRLCALAAFASSAATTYAQRQVLTTQIIANGTLTRPVYVTAPAGDTSRIFVIEQRSGTPATGKVRIIQIPSNTLLVTPFLTTPNVATGGEQGLLGLAFHPNYMQNGYLYVYYTEPPTANSAGSSVIAEYRATGGNAMSNTVDPASARVVLRFAQPDANHNGGWIDFGPDGFLYIASGDGGCANDNNCSAPNPPSVGPGHTAGTGNAQDITSNLLGKMLRIDIDGSDNVPASGDEDAFPADTDRNYWIPATNPYVGITGDDEIWAHGLRNPWRNSFDRLTGALWIADVGQGAREEINVSNSNAPGLNYGWRCMEGTRCTGLAGCTCNAVSLTLPVLEYGHNAGTAIGPTTIQGCSITGGYVYRGSSMPCLRGRYIFADYCSGDIWTFRYSNGVVSEVVNRTVELDPPGTITIGGVTSFGQDANGELYICAQTGNRVFKIVANGFDGTITDCNANQRPDSCDIEQNFSMDANANMIPDECECDPDYNMDGGADLGDVFDLANDVAGGSQSFPPNTPDFNADGSIDNSDIFDIANTVASGQCP